MTTINNNTWYYLPTLTAPVYGSSTRDTFIACESALNTTPIYTQNYNNQVLLNTNNYIPIPSTNYGIICGTRILPMVAGTLTINIISSSGNTIDCYYSTTHTNTLNPTRTTLTGSANSVVTQTISMDLNTAYTIFLTQQNNNINTNMFINASYNGKYLPINSAFNGTVLN